MRNGQCSELSIDAPSVQRPSNEYKSHEGRSQARERAEHALARSVPCRYAARVTSERSGVVTRAANAVTTPLVGGILQCAANYALLH